MKCFMLTIFLILSAMIVYGADDTKPAAKPNVEKTIPPESTFIKVDCQPEMIKEAAPEYPDQAKKEKIEGTVTVQAYVDAQGNILRARAISCSMPDKGFEEAALKSAYQNKYKPAKQKDKPVGVWISYKVVFKLG